MCRGGTVLIGLLKTPELLFWRLRVLLPLPGLLLMCAPSSVETSTSTGFGDWLNREGGRVALFTSLLPLLHRLPSCPPFPFSDNPPALCEPLSWGDKGPGVSASHGMNSMGSAQPRNYWGGRGSHLFFFLFLFFQNKNGASLPYQLLILTARVWRWAYVCESECTHWFH